MLHFVQFYFMVFGQGQSTKSLFDICLDPTSNIFESYIVQV